MVGNITLDPVPSNGLLKGAIHTTEGLINIEGIPKDQEALLQDQHRKAYIDLNESFTKRAARRILELLGFVPHPESARLSPDGDLETYTYAPAPAVVAPVVVSHEEDSWGNGAQSEDASNPQWLSEQSNKLENIDGQTPKRLVGDPPIGDATEKGTSSLSPFHGPEADESLSPFNPPHLTHD